MACEIIVTQRDVILLNSQHSYLLFLLCIASSRLFIFRDPMSEVKDCLINMSDFSTSALASHN